MIQVDPNQVIGDTVYNPQSVKPLREEDCRIPIPKTTFFIVGGAKCGSTTLTSVLASHPDCCHSAPKETNFFTLNFDQGWDWYRGNFAHYDGERVVGEASVSYGSIPHRKDVAGVIREYNPSAKIIYIVRHPWHKLVSGWKMALTGPGYLGNGAARKSFEDYVLHELPRYDDVDWKNPTHGWSAAQPSSDSMTRIWLDTIYYEGQVENYLRHFPEDHVKVMFLEDWKRQPDLQAVELCNFLDLDPEELPTERPAAVNRADERRRQYPLYSWFANSDVLRPIRHLFPQNFRHAMRRKLANSPLGSHKIKYPDLSMSETFRSELLSYLQAKSSTFLQRHGKPQSFWDFENIN